jgi:hypothetical protein
VHSSALGSAARLSGPRRRTAMRFALLIQNRVINPLVRLLLGLGLGPPTYALLETTGRRTGSPRQLPWATVYEETRSG